MNLIIWIYLTVASWPNAFGWYYIEKQEIFLPPTNLRNNSYFGYSITYDESNKALVISAPNENNFGEVYYCNIEDRTCNPIKKDGQYLKSNYTYWFGATVKAGRDFVMMCAPRYDIESKARGTCYSYANGRLNKNEKINEEIRFADAGLPMDTKHGQIAMDSFGWCIDVASDGAIMVGGPGMYHGRTMIYKNRFDTNPNFIRTTEHTPQFNFGYAVASGSFINKSLSYAVSSTYGTDGCGQVAFYEGLTFINISNNPINGSNIGSMFGAVLCAASLSGERTDLLVGAPTYATKRTYNLGAVYVYLALTNNVIPVFKRKIVGQVSGSMFGSAIVNVGDLDGDKKHEIAIAAPFEKNGHGVVYLYSGADLISELTEKDLKFIQIIEPGTSYGESFGMSLTALQDYDENGCKELAVGSPYKDTVVLLRCVATIDVETSTKPPNLQGLTTSNITDFEFEVCLSIKKPSLPKKIIALVSTTVEMFHKYAKLTHTNNTGQFTYETSLNETKSEYCRNVSFTLPPEGEYDSIIDYNISSKLLNDPRTLPEFNSSRVILSNRSMLTFQNSFWAYECPNNKNKTCAPNLILTPYISFDHDGDPYVIGSSEKETMSITVYNSGDKAYAACVRIYIIGVNMLTIPTGCAFESLADRIGLVCKPSRPILTNKTWNIDQIVLEMKHLTNLNKNISINMLLFDHCKDNVTKTIPKIIPVMADPRGITMKGETDIGSIVNMTNEDIERNGKKMQHIYTIVNKGPTNWKQLSIQVTLQMQPYIKYDTDSPVSVYDSTRDSYTPCLSQNESRICVVEALTTKEFARIHVPIYIVPGTLDKIIDKHTNTTITSSINLKFTDHDNKTESVTTIITLLEAPIPIETIIIAVVFGICILSIVTVILYKVGFLRRKNKAQLEKLKNSVKRQSTLHSRTSMRQSHAPVGNDQSPILQEEQQEQEGYEQTNKAFT
ncbi:hypothetical protein PYW07_003645 [Mythimna separata]|uniref:Uncharacterized protein n=1 Tax=Mythimna separata TaxID=271217 RepID=A0AAD7YNR0_MYTSE|nr:hypothetical protein PYW07_003645 [Mythimna separata]